MNSLDETSKRFVAVLSKKMDTGRTLNVLGHVSVGLSNLIIADDAVYIDYTDCNGNLYKNISRYPFIVLKADNSNKIRRLREEAIARDLKFTVFIDTMIEGGSTIQQANTSKTAEADLNYLGICLFGKTEVIKELTKKFSLYK